MISQTFSESEEFDMKIFPRMKLLQLSNKNTFLVEDIKNEGLHAKLYSESRKIIKEGKLNLTRIPDIGNFSSGIKALFEVNKEIVFFYKRTDKAIHQLIRVIIDPVTGNIRKEEEVAELTGNEYETFFEIAKDRDSDYYAVFKINFKTGIEVLHFSPNHTVIHKSNYTTPNKEYKFFKPTNFFVHKDEFVVIVSKVLNTDPINMAFVTINPKETLKYYVSKCNKGENGFTSQELSYVSDKNSFIGFELLYNNKFDLLHLFACINTEGKKMKHQQVFLNNIVINKSLEIKNAVKVDSSELINYSKNKLDRKKEYNALLKDLHVDPQGDILLLFRDVKTGYGNCENIGDIGILKLSSEGKLIQSQIFPYSYNECPPENMSGSFNAYSSGLFFTSTDKFSYLLLNNVEKNMELNNKETADMKTLTKVKGVKYSLNNEISKVEFLECNSTKEINAFFYEISNYNKDLKTYCILVNNPKIDKSSLVWLKLD